MADKTDNLINEYYSSVDKNLIKNLCKDNNLKNLINLSTVSDLYIFNKKNKKWHLKSKDKLIKECEIIKKKELKTSSCMLSNLAKLNSNNNPTDVKGICDNLQNKINNLDNLIKCIQHLDSSVDIIPITYESDTNNESNVKTNTIITNIVSFDDAPKQKTKKETKNKNLVNNENLEKKESVTEIKIINLNHDLNKYNYNTSDTSDNFIECYSNC